MLVAYLFVYAYFIRVRLPDNLGGILYYKGPLGLGMAAAKTVEKEIQGHSHMRRR